MLQLVMPMLKAAGIDGQLRLMDRSLWEVRIRQNMDYDATTNRFGGGGGLAAILDPRYFVPFSDNAFYAPGWQIWYGDKTAANAVEPPQQVQDALKLYDEMKSTVDDAKRVDCSSRYSRSPPTSSIRSASRARTTATASARTTCATFRIGFSTPSAIRLLPRPTRSSISRRSRL